MQLSLLLTDGDDARLLLEVARQADRRGLAALWLPEQHSADGADGDSASLFPNPAVAAAALAVETQRLGLRAAGLALPLHNPIRVAEEWSLVDNLSRGRVGIALGAADEDVETVRRLWRGEAVRVPDGEGHPIDIRILPQPLQPELPLWLTDAQTAAILGANLLLTEPDADRIAAYRAANGYGTVTVTVPAFASVEDGGWELERCEEMGASEVACRVRLAGALAALEVLEELRHGG
ncbi:MAG TPA: LLM class flavin-dependent oxidoreductase [Thermoanaerobaculia bacterium]|nr:LLM class flavin-dependent oxidoreductase [Thermoanaerobaculia bacterium]